jgi:hypothetical protein
MSRRMVGILILLAGSEALGLLSGHWYFGIFTRTVPAAVVTDFNRATAYGYFLWRGLLLGLLFFLWALAAALSAPLFRKTAGDAEPVRPSR